MITTRRQVLMMGSGTLAFAALTGLPAFASTVDERIAEFTGGADVADEGVTLTAPEIAENGNTVPITVSAEGATAIMILAAGNPNPDVATFNFGAVAAESTAGTRIRLAGTQDVLAVARMADGTYAQARQEVKVTIGGCGG